MTDLIKLPPTWHRIIGFGYGLRQPGLAGFVSVGAVDERRLRSIEQGLQSLLDEPLPVRPGGQPAIQRIGVLFAFVQGAIQRQSRIAVSELSHVRWRKAGGGQDAGCELVIPAPSLRATQVALKWTVTVFNALGQGGAIRPGSQDQAQDQARDEIHAKLRPFANPGLNTFSIILAADRVAIPLHHLKRTVVVLGTGMHSRWMDSTMTDMTPAIGANLAKQKHATAAILRSSGLPGGVNEVVKSAQEAVTAAARLGYPVVVKPADREQGVGVCADIRDEASVAQAYEAAREASPTVLVEKWAPGSTHRLTVFNGKIIRVSRRIAGGVVGDGVSDIAALVEGMQQHHQHLSSKRRLGKVLLAVDDEAIGLLKQNGLTERHVPKAGEYVRLRRRDNINAGGTNEFLALAAVHPDNQRLAIDAARLLRLDFAGIDLIMRDISRSWFGTEALICEINAQPQMGGRTQPGLYEGVLAELMGDNRRIPAHLLVCPADEARQRAALDHALGLVAPNGVSAKGGLWIDGTRSTAAFDNGFSAAQALLRRTDVRNAVCLVTAAEIARLGLPLDRWDRIEFVDHEVIGKEHAALLARVQAMIRGHQAGSIAGAEAPVAMQGA